MFSFGFFLIILQFVWKRSYMAWSLCVWKHEAFCNSPYSMHIIYDSALCVAEKALSGQRAARATRRPGAGGRRERQRERQRERVSDVRSDGRARLYGRPQAGGAARWDRLALVGPARCPRSSFASPRDPSQSPATEFILTPRALVEFEHRNALYLLNVLISNDHHLHFRAFNSLFIHGCLTNVVQTNLFNNRSKHYLHSIIYCTLYSVFCTSMWIRVQHFAVCGICSLMSCCLVRLASALSITHCRLRNIRDHCLRWAYCIYLISLTVLKAHYLHIPSVFAVSSDHSAFDP